MFPLSPDDQAKIAGKRNKRARIKQSPFWFEHLADAMPHLEPNKKADVALAVIRILTDTREPAAKQRKANLANLAKDLLRPADDDEPKATPPRVG